MARHTLDDAIDLLLDRYREWLEESPENVAAAWLERCDEHAEVLEEDGEDILVTEEE
jgi:hypothetical protein